MKKIISIFLMVTTISYCQISENSIALSVGITEKNGTGILLNYNYKEKRSIYEAGVLYSRFKDTDYITVDYNITTLQVGYLYDAFRNNRNSINFSIGGGISGSYESIENPNQIELKSKNGFFFGFYATGQLELYIIEKLSFLIRVQQNYSPNATTGAFNPYIGAGIKFNFN